MKQLLLVMISTSLLSACGGSNKVETPPVVVEPPVVVVKTKDQAMAAVLVALADEVIVPSYQQLLAHSTEFEIAATRFCSLSNSAQSDLDVLRTSWLNLNASWQSTRPTKLGPIFKEFRYSRLQTWPDNNAAVARGIAALLATNPITAQAVAQTQDGGQGLPALEYLLYPDQAGQNMLSAPNKSERCLVTMAVAANIKSIAQELVDGWSASQGNYREQYIQGSGDFVSPQDAIEEQLTNWFELVEIITDNKIGKALGVLPPGVLKNAEQFRSQSSLANIKHNLEALEQVYLAKNSYGFDDYLIEIHQAQSLDTSIKGAFAEVFEALEKITVPLEEAIVTSEGRAQLKALSNKVKALRTIMASDFVQTTGFNPSFNSNDGD
ncbi:imelysin family protein [Pseudoalteromonas tunicata]|jgi:predicted lipoprotein|uniref:Predicted periplasmic lipoprotein n=1 Tax=Pseudoalteromonas tunicata D2 TaxID=87626 RepID=A4C9C2_9GAMM|nr:imelysin family protein [Pseudoalteromonas tunicata]ATC93691.1 hypothetical protein PTUN_a0990 [Pseudoalteromonas tunicata]AXT29519.1 hypothetical protein D1819_00875 [Pseudoalteromonas tunicata]EAR29187.1 predicted periplasmic lipoprotein [Pseudoalteromonas tunicata D2]